MLNGKPIYQPGKKKKKIPKKLLYLISAIVLIIIILVVVLINIKKPEDVHRGFSIEEVILQEVELNSLLREEVLSTNGVVWWEDIDFPPQTKEKIQSMTPYFINCVAKICEISDSCFLTEEETEKLNLSSKKVYSEAILISPDQAEKNKIFRIFCWGVVEEHVGEDIINDTDILEPFCGNKVIEGFEECDGSDWGPITGCNNFDSFTGGTLNCGTSCQFDTSLCTGGTPGVCGDGNINTGEQCDGSDWGPITGCSNFNNFTGGTLSCGTGCQFDISLCTTGTLGICGDGNINTGEQCDGTTLGGKTCQYFGYKSGNLSCENCTFDFSGCFGCFSEKDVTFCLRHGKNCGLFSGIDNCGETRTVNCGSCVSPETCGGGGLSNVCGEEECVPETNKTFCSRYGKYCGVFSGTDNCGKTRTLNCGGCVFPKTCINNICIEICQPNCGGKCGGPNGCGGTCPNTCTGGLVCKAPSYKFCGPKSSVEFLGRGLIALPKNNGIYLGWRLLPWDNPNVGFNVYRATNVNGPFTKISNVPIKTSTNYYHQNVLSGTYYYMVRTDDGQGLGPESNKVRVTAGTSKSYIPIPVQPCSDACSYVGGIATGDVNGDGILDFLLLRGHPDDVYVPHQIEAVLSEDGTWISKWRVSTGKPPGIWYSDGENPALLVWDLDGDAKAEIITRTGPLGGGSLSVLDPEDGHIKHSTPWPTIGGHTEITAIAVAFLDDLDGDGVLDPVVVTQTGWSAQGPLFPRFAAFSYDSTNGFSKVRDVRFPPCANTGTCDRDNGIFGWDADNPEIRAMGTHGFATADIDDDDKDEVLLGSAVLHDDWQGYWMFSYDHCDACQPGDIDPLTPGPELFIACGTPAALIDFTPTGGPTTLWSHDAFHWDGWDKGWCADLSGTYNGLECVGADQDESTTRSNGGLPPEWQGVDYYTFSSDGTDISSQVPVSVYGYLPIDWHVGEGVKEVWTLCRSTQEPGTHSCWFEWGIADVVGDSREENFAYHPDSDTLRIYTNIAANNQRYVTPLADRGYRTAVSRIGTYGYQANFIPIKTNQPRLDIVPGL